MASNPVFAATPRSSGVTTNGTADTSLTSPSSTATVFTAGAGGSKVEQIRFFQIISTTAAGIVNVFLHDGSTYYPIDYYSYSVNSLSTTSQVAPVDFFYPNLVLPSGWSIRVANTVASGSGSTAATHRVVAFGGDF